MTQQYVLLRKENNLLNSLIGQSFNQRTKFESYKILKEIHKQADQYSMEKALCYIVDKGEIKGVGGSSLMKNKKTGEIVSDLILDQFGEWLSGIFVALPSGIVGRTVKNSAGTPQTVRLWAITNAFNDIETLGAFQQVGSGSTPPARTDLTLETPFGTAPENATFSTGNPVYNSGLGNFKPAGLITAGGSGTINESVMFFGMKNSVGSNNTFGMFRDIISPAQSFIAGQTIALEYTIQL